MSSSTAQLLGKNGPVAFADDAVNGGIALLQQLAADAVSAPAVAVKAVLELHELLGAAKQRV